MTRSSAAKQRDDLKAAGKRTDDYKTPTAAGKRSRATEKPDNRPTSEASEKSTKRQKPTVKSSATKEPPSGTSTQPKEVQDSSTSPRTRYWLFKSEPESRISERGHDVKFSLDDLIASPNSTAPWDGVRNYGARNNLRAMKVGDLGFFYHSNCKEPGIVGIVEVAAEAVPDGTIYPSSEFLRMATDELQSRLLIQTPITTILHQKGKIQSGSKRTCGSSVE